MFFLGNCSVKRAQQAEQLSAISNARVCASIRPNLFKPEVTNRQIKPWRNDKRLFSSSQTGPVTTNNAPALLILEKQIAADKREEFNMWQARGQGIFDGVLGPGRAYVEHAMPGETGAVLPGDKPMAACDASLDDRDIVVVVFDSDESRKTLHTSKEFEEWVKQGRHLQTRVKRRTVTLGGFMSPVPSASAKGPPKWKIMCTVLFALYPTQQVMAHGVLPIVFTHMPDFPPPIKEFVAFCFVCPVMVGVMMPTAHKILSRWFLPEAKSAGREALNLVGILAVYSSYIYISGFMQGYFPGPSTLITLI